MIIYSSSSHFAACLDNCLSGPVLGSSIMYAYFFSVPLLGLRTAQPNKRKSWLQNHAVWLNFILAFHCFNRSFWNWPYFFVIPEDKNSWLLLLCLNGNYIKLLSSWVFSCWQWCLFLDKKHSREIQYSLQNHRG